MGLKIRLIGSQRYSCLGKEKNINNCEQSN